MAIKDKALRLQAVPYYGQIFGYNRSQNSDQDVSMTILNPGGGYAGDPAMSGNGDLFPLITDVQQNDYMIRILRPKFGQIVQAYLTLSLTFAVAETHPNFNISVGYGFNSDRITPLVPPTSYITQCMNVLKPTGGTFSGTAGHATTLVLNIQSLIPQVGAANYVADFYTIGLHFPVAITMSGTWHLSKFFVTGSIMVT